MLRVFVFVTLIVWTSAMNDGGFARFCADEFQESKLERTEDDVTCTATFELNHVTPETSTGICRHRSRFALKMPQSSDSQLNCTYEMTGKCLDGNYIDGYCYKAMAKCEDYWSPAPWTDRQAFRWIARAYESLRIAKFHLPKAHKEPTLMFQNNTLVPLPDNKKREKVVLLHRMPVFGGYPHDIVYLAEEQPSVVTICRSDPFGEIGWDQTNTEAISSGIVTSHGSAANGGRIIKSKDKSYNLVLSRNVYSLKMTNNGELDLQYFHNVCKGICKSCFAATPSYLEPSKLDGTLPKGRFWLPGGRRAVKGSTDCSPSRDESSLKQWAILYHDNHRKKNGILDEKYWKSGLPNRACSDQGRYAMAYDNGGVIDVPIFDRLPLICVRGKPLEMPDDCLRYSESDGKGGCKCMEGYKDVNDETLWKNQNATTEDVKKYAMSKDTRPGHLCVRESCIESKLRKLPYQALLFVIDGSGSVGDAAFRQMRDWVYKAKDFLPSDVRIILQQYGTGPNAHRGEVPAGWNHAQYDAAVHAAIGNYAGGGTETYGAMEDVMNYWLSTQDGAGKALMIVITDGEAFFHPRRTAIVKTMRNNGIYLKYVGVGNADQVDMVQMKLDVQNSETDVIRLENYDKLQTDLGWMLTTSINCQPITEADVDEANQKLYE